MRIPFMAVGLAVLCGCVGHREPSARLDEDRFRDFSTRYVAAYLQWRPHEATALGFHEHDGRLTDVSQASIDRELARLRAARTEADSFRATRLSPDSQYELQMLRRAIDRELFQLEQLRPFHRNPMAYAAVANVDIYIKRDFAPFAERLRSVQGILEQVPVALQHARANLEPVLPQPFVETAIEMAGGVADFWEKDLATAIATQTTPQLEAARQKAVSEMRAFATWLEKERAPRATPVFALGERRYRKLLKVGELIETSPDALLQIGLRELRETQRQFEEVARRIDPTRPAVDVYKAIQQDHPTAENLIPDTARNLEAIRQFVSDRRLLTIPSAVRVKVLETPGFMRAVSFASMDTPGPFETKATEAYYYVTPVESHWPEAQKEEWLTAFNYYTTDIVSIHEAYPGHYVQFLCLNASGASRVAKIFNSYAFIEGWAHYTEQMMMEQGFGSGPKFDRYHLAQLGEALLRLCRMCVSLQMHCRDMSVEEGTQFFMRECYYERKTAYAEARRGAYDPEYLYYTLGKLQLLKLRADWKAQEGETFSLQRFHDEMLGHGAPPIRLLRERMLTDSRSWAAVL